MTLRMMTSKPGTLRRPASVARSAGCSHARALIPRSRREAPRSITATPALPAGFASGSMAPHLSEEPPMPPQFIYVMKGLKKIVPPQREILRGIWLSFFPGAKIGVLGANGSGKSTLLRIMAGLEKDFAGEAYPAEGTRIGFLSQDPALDPKKTVLGNAEEAAPSTRALLARF